MNVSQNLGDEKVRLFFTTATGTNDCICFATDQLILEKEILEVSLSLFKCAEPLPGSESAIAAGYLVSWESSADNFYQSRPEMFFRSFTVAPKIESDPPAIVAA